MKLYRTTQGLFVEQNGRFFPLAATGLDELLSSATLPDTLSRALTGESASSLSGSPLPIVQNQEVWAAGVTYYRSRNARIEESKDAGGGDFYDRVYLAQRPELFFKSTG